LRVNESQTNGSYLGHIVIWIYYKTVHLCFCFGAGAGQRTALIASSKTVLSPLVVNAEHSKYLTAPTSLAIERPVVYFVELQFDKIRDGNISNKDSFVFGNF